MSSLRRILSLECTGNKLQPDLVRHRSLPIFSFYNPLGLPSLPFPTSRLSKTLHGSCSHDPSYCGHKRDKSLYQFAFFRPVPARCAADEADSGACTITLPISRNQSLEMENSVVYKELCDSIRCLEAPPRYVRVLNSEGVSGSTQVAELYEEESKKKKVEPSGIDVRGRPMSLRMLKRRVSRVSGSFIFSDAEQGMLREYPVLSSNGEARDGMLHDMGGSVDSAFSSLVFMMESLQQHMLRLRRVLMSEADACLHVMMLKVHQEMQDTFLWLFQQVFSCTPKLMLLTMMLLVDFGVHSMGKHVALGVMPMGEPPTCVIERAVTTKAPSFDRFNASSYGSGSTDSKIRTVTTHLIQGSLAEPRLCEGGAGDKGVRAVKVGGSMDGEAMPITSADGAAMTMEDDTHGGLNDATFCGCCPLLDGEGFFKPGAGLCSDDLRMLSSMWQQAVFKELNPRPLTQTRQMLVAPVRAPALEADDYPCYDRTDLKYQHELNRDPSNALLLANYAQFLHVVRHDHDRAEVLYKRAVKADPVDGEVMGKYASFLWVAKEDAEAADEAYKTALAVDPTNAYHAGSYAHFLWNSSSGQGDTASTSTTSYQQVSTS